jgi:hypothetical protein
LTLKVDLYEPAIITCCPDGLTVGTGLHGEHTTLMTGEVVFAQLHHPIAKPKGGAISQPGGTNSWGRIGQGPFLAL